MPKIDFLRSGAGSAKTVDAPDGGALVDICDLHLAPVPFSCRSASCATCHVEILEGMDLLEPPRPDEAELLAVIRAPATTRLACQARVRPGSGLIRIRPVDLP